jgi:branched-chain amino acid transport system permease protein
MRRLLLVGLCAAMIVLLPFLVPAGWVVVLSKMLIASLFALAFNLLAGQAGMLSFGHAAYFAVGTFGTLHLMRAAEAGFAVPTPLIPLAGALAGLFCGMICGMFATLRSGVYFSMITLAIAELLYNLAPNLHDLFGGEGGLSSFRMPFAGLTFGSDREVYYLVAFWTMIGALGLYFYTQTPFGRLTLALRENEQRARFLGFNTYQSRVVIFAISAMVSGLAGGLLAVAVVLNTFIGGSGVFLGPAVGAVLLTGFSHVVSDATRLVLLYQGAIFILVMVYAPQGIGGALAAHRESIRGRWWPRLVVPYLLLCVPLLSLTVAAVFTMELVGRFFSTEQIGLMRRAGRLLPVMFMGREWSALSPLTWVLPIGLAALGALTLRRSMSGVRRIWTEERA